MVAPYTRFGPEGYGVRREGSFSGKTPGVVGHPVGKITRLGEAGYGVRRNGPFAGKTASTGSNTSLACDTGTFSVAGNALVSQITVSLATGAYIIAGKTLASQITGSLASGSYVIVGQTLTSQIVVGVATGAYVVTGHSAMLSNTGGAVATTLVCDTGTFSVNGNPATLTFTPFADFAATLLARGGAGGFDSDADSQAERRPRARKDSVRRKLPRADAGPIAPTIAPDDQLPLPIPGPVRLTPPPPNDDEEALAVIAQATQQDIAALNELLSALKVLWLPEGDATKTIPGAKLAPDGHHYVPDPNRPGKYLRIKR